ncbi:hypothetical protein FIBSPDRAFT_388354 [Athelia psychrophila]|uniref:G-protein coupled receptors family 1 profile domain-containing protein n=1 Tax=Athelia psychrophila TaxID=1759441 RepID=A0A166NT78_9AGAM|nr:hypothetical protein FIBSPDRAFT_388354 [Fibularhizoctonia sp. CBS 109695]
MTSPAPINPVASAIVWQSSSYLYTVQITAYTYEWLLSISDECAMVSNSGMTWSISIYFLSRISQLIYLGVVMAYSAPTVKCDFKLLTVTIAVCASVTGAATTYMFLLRVRAVYLKSMRITALFGALWLVTQGLLALTSTAVHAAPNQPSQYCNGLYLKYGILPSAAIFAYDTLVFLAISYRLAEDASTKAGWRSRIMSVTKGHGLHRLSRSIMRSGLQYYLASLLFSLTNLVLMLSPAPPAARYSLVTMYIGFTNIMACRVFRGVALGMMERSPTMLNSTEIAAAFQLCPLSSDGDVPSFGVL